MPMPKLPVLVILKTSGLLPPLLVTRAINESVVAAPSQPDLNAAMVAPASPFNVSCVPRFKAAV